MLLRAYANIARRLAAFQTYDPLERRRHVRLIVEIADAIEAGDPEFDRDEFLILSGVVRPDPP